MRQAAVGQKCPKCARLPRSARAIGKPVHYVRGGLAGLGVALAGGVAAAVVSLFVGGFGTVALPALVGFGVGHAVGWGAQRQTHRNFEVMAVALGVLGGIVAAVSFGRGGPVLALGPFSVLGIVAAGYFARRGLHA